MFAAYRRSMIALFVVSVAMLGVLASTSTLVAQDGNESPLCEVYEYDNQIRVIGQGQPKTGYTSVNAAINDAQSNFVPPVTVYIPAGTWPLDPVTVTIGDLSIVGVGGNNAGTTGATTILEATTSDEPMFAGASLSSFRIMSLVLDGNTIATAGVDSDTSIGSDFGCLVVRDVTEFAIGLSSPSSVGISNSIHDSDLSTDPTVALTLAIILSDQYSSIISNTIHDVDNAVYIEWCELCEISKNEIEPVYDGVRSYELISTEISGNSIDVSDSDAAAINVLESGDGVYIEDNTTNARFYLNELIGGANNISGNTLLDGRITAYVYDGVDLEVNDNYVGGVSSSGIEVASDTGLGNGQNVEVTENLIVSSGSAGIRVAGLKNVLVRANTVRYAEKQGVYVAGNSNRVFQNKLYCNGLDGTSSAVELVVDGVVLPTGNIVSLNIIDHTPTPVILDPNPPNNTITPNTIAVCPE